MPVIGITTKNIEAKRSQDAFKNVKINNETRLTDVEEKDLAGLGKKGLVVSYEYRSDYIDGSKSFASIKIGGEVVFIDPNQAEIIKGWKKDKKLPDKVNVQVINAILRKCVIKALSISEEVGLPPVIRLPFAAAKKAPKESRYIG